MVLDIIINVYYYVYKEVYEMRTNIELDDNLVKEAFKYADVKTKKDLIDLSLKEFVANRRRKDISELKGKIKFANGYDHKAMRKDVK